MIHEEDLKRVGGCQGRGQCGCAKAGRAQCAATGEPIIDRDPGDENDRQVVFTQLPQEALEGFTIVERHPSSQAFHDRMDAYKALHDRKQADYGSDQDPFANVRNGARKLGLPGWIGAVIRMNDKIERLNKAAKQYIETGEINLANEGVLDSFDDLAVYSGIGAVLFEEEAA